MRAMSATAHAGSAVAHHEARLIAFAEPFVVRPSAHLQSRFRAVYLFCVSLRVYRAI
ncbi:hypothetical protein HMPREF3196_01751 [Bifidobacterium bifidum]|uniref:Uncharacterized protein n=1 Tax=Bifidobacterium bifidum TaxID=1681 RepID=A0A133KLK2_BIFBI|nr:hypothetical protein BIFBIF_01379 [Bifidobacterium bifidum ATCC 29521 = JCM 1255 = DSM 20456]KWZ80421.1 hypothetical protein HMPREF3196_01751 [Bifidobacterium bifidum]